MRMRYDAIIIGAGIIGACGTRYATLDGAALAREGFFRRDDRACEAGRDHDRDPLPFRLERAGHTISIGFFSGLREVNRETSFSVLG